jgi:Fe-S-cluster containining protein
VSKSEQRERDKARAVANADERRRVVLRVLQGCDEAGAKKLAHLATTGSVASCSAGCSHCCRLEIPVSRPEAEVLVAWLTEHRTHDELDAIRAKLRAWLAWYRTELPALAMDRTEAFARHAPKCALLAPDGRCGAYEVRPVTCRNYFVSSPVSECDPATTTREPTAMLAVAQATYHHVVEIRRTIERQGGNYMASVHQLPEWLVHLLGVETEPWSR